jgi:hypothetical protein
MGVEGMEQGDAAGNRLARPKAKPKANAYSNPETLEMKWDWAKIVWICEKEGIEVPWVWLEIESIRGPGNMRYWWSIFIVAIFAFDGLETLAFERIVLLFRSLVLQMRKPSSCILPVFHFSLHGLTTCAISFDLSLKTCDLAIVQRDSAVTIFGSLM